MDLAKRGSYVSKEENLPPGKLQMILGLTDCVILGTVEVSHNREGVIVLGVEDTGHGDGLIRPHPSFDFCTTQPLRRQEGRSV